ncbi:MAG: MATE family efflux transporter [Clostridia bacterium]|nr:MATE family efflux transporter [Clostridia bacterium]
MGVMPVNKLLITMSLPMMASMLIQALYNVVDSVFVAKIGEEAITALSLAFPVQNLMIGVATGTGVGMNALLSRSLGEKDAKRVNQAATNGVALAMLSSVLFILFGIFFSRTFFAIQTDNELIIKYGAQYISICTIGSAFLYISIIFERLMQATGKTIYSMYTQGIGAITNIILDPILIFVCDLDVIGAALATVIGQMLSCFTGILLNYRYNYEITLNFKGFKFHGETVKRIYSVGVPSMLMMGIGSVMNFSLNKILIDFFSTTAAAVLGIYYKIQSFAFMPLFGLNNGIVPIIAYNYGAGKRKRITKCIRLAITYATGIMLIAILVFQIFPKELLLMFEASEHMLSIGVPAFRIISIHYLFAGFCIVMGTVFQAFGKGALSLVVSICRQLVVLLPAAYLLAILFKDNINMFWLCFPIAEVMSLTVSAICYMFVYKKIIKPIPNNA